MKPGINIRLLPIKALQKVTHRNTNHQPNQREKATKSQNADKLDDLTDKFFFEEKEHE